MRDKHSFLSITFRLVTRKTAAMTFIAPAFLPADALDDFHVSEEFAFYARVTAALEFLLRVREHSTPERVFRLYELTEDDLRLFYERHPQETEKFKAAYESGLFVCPVTSCSARTFAIANAPANGAELLF